MTGLSLNELKQYLKTNREIEFTYGGSSYTIEPDGVKNNVLFTIWRACPDSEQSTCVFEYVGLEGTAVEEKTIDDFLKAKCFAGKSFMDIEDEVTVDAIF